MKSLSRISLYMLTLLWACQQPLEYRLDDYGTQLVVSSDLAVDSLPEIYLKVSRPYNGYVEQTLDLDFIEDAQVLLFQGDVVDTLRPFMEQQAVNLFTYGFYYQSEVDSVMWVNGYRGMRNIRAGETYRLEIRYEDQVLTAETVAPAAVTISQIEAFSSFYDEQTDFYQQSRVEATFDAVAASNLGYRMRMSYSYPDIFFDYDPDTGEQEIDSILVPVLLFSQSVPSSGGEVTISEEYFASFRFGERDTIMIQVQIETLNEDLFAFWQSVEAQQSDAGNPLVEPTLLRGNVEGGLGVFGIHALTPTKEVMAIDEF